MDSIFRKLQKSPLAERDCFAGKLLFVSNDSTTAFESFTRRQADSISQFADPRRHRRLLVLAVHEFFSEELGLGV